MASVDINKQGRLKLGLFLLLSVSFLLPANAQITRRQLLRSFHKAATYNNAGDFDKAIEAYRQIAEQVPQYPDTYLRMAEIYDKANNVELAVLMYRKYINLEMDDAKILEPSARLRTLETQLGIEHYEDTEEREAMEVFAKYNVIQQSEQMIEEGRESVNVGQSLQLFAGNASQQQHCEEEKDNDTSEKYSSDEPEDNDYEPSELYDSQMVPTTTGGLNEGLVLFSLSALVETRNESLGVSSSNNAVDSITEEERKELERFTNQQAQLDNNMASISDEFTQVDKTNIEDTISLDETFLSKVYMNPVDNTLKPDDVDLQSCDYPLQVYAPKERMEEYDICRSDATGNGPQKVDPQSLSTILSGKWVSSECKGNGHETWIFNISQTGDVWYVNLDDRSGIYLSDDDDNFVNASLKTIKSLWTYDHAISNQIKELQTKTVNGGFKNDRLSYTFVTEHQQKPHKAVYTWGRNILEGVAGFIPFGGVVSQVGNTLINYVSEKDQQKTYTTTLQFYVKALTNNVLMCEYIMSEKERSSAGEKEIHKERKACYLYKVDDNYRGFDFQSDNEYNVVNRKLYALLKKEAETDVSKLYPLTYMYYYGAGTSKSISKAVHQMQVLAEKGNCDRAKSWLVPICYNLSMDEKAYPYRVVRKYFRNYADEMLGDLLMKNYPYAYSLQADIYMSEEKNMDKIVPLYQKAASLGDVYALYKLGLVYVDGVIEQQNVSQAISYLSKAAEKGYADAFYELALLYKRAKLVEKDYAKYIDYLHCAVDHGSVKALKELSDAYYLGLGVTADFNVANRIKDRYMKASCEEWKEVLHIYGYNTVL